MSSPHDMRRFSIAATALTTLVAVTSAGGCTRQAHTRSDFGVATRAVFDHQARAASRGPTQGLDSEEASAIQDRYREAIGKRGAPPRNDPRSSVLRLEEGRHDAAKHP